MGNDMILNISFNDSNIIDQENKESEIHSSNPGAELKIIKSPTETEP